MFRYLLITTMACLCPASFAQTTADDSALQRSVKELRESIGRWEVVTEFLNSDGSVSRSVKGTYEFSWIVPDKVITGKTEIPELSMAAGILFYINEKTETVEMVSVGADGKLWIMTGPIGGDQRTTQEYETQNGGKGQLRFTRYNVTANTFESKMEFTTDGGKTWTPGNHQQFQRANS